MSDNYYVHPPFDTDYSLLSRPGFYFLQEMYARGVIEAKELCIIDIQEYLVKFRISPNRVNALVNRSTDHPFPDWKKIVNEPKFFSYHFFKAINFTLIELHINRRGNVEEFTGVYPVRLSSDIIQSLQQKRFKDLVRQSIMFRQESHFERVFGAIQSEMY